MKTETGSADTSAVSRGGPGRGLGQGILIGLVPIALFYVIATLAILLTTLVRDLTNGQGFLAQLPLVVSTLGGGLVMAFVAWIAGCIWALRRAQTWERAGDAMRAITTQWMLGASTLLLLAPVIVAILLPQHPAHPAAP